MALSAVIGLVNAVKGVVGLITDPKSKASAEAKVLDAQAEALAESYDLERQLLAAKTDIIVAEAQSESTLARIWRPVVMLTFTGMIVAAQIGGTEVPEQMWPLLKLGIGGYVVGRSVEKIVPKIIETIKKTH